MSVVLRTKGFFSLYFVCLFWCYLRLHYVTHWLCFIFAKKVRASVQIVLADLMNKIPAELFVPSPGGCERIIKQKVVYISIIAANSTIISKHSFYSDCVRLSNVVFRRFSKQHFGESVCVIISAAPAKFYLKWVLGSWNLHSYCCLKFIFQGDYFQLAGAYIMSYRATKNNYFFLSFRQKYR